MKKVIIEMGPAEERKSIDAVNLALEVLATILIKFKNGDTSISPEMAIQTAQIIFSISENR